MSRELFYQLLEALRLQLIKDRDFSIASKKVSLTGEELVYDNTVLVDSIIDLLSHHIKWGIDRELVEDWVLSNACGEKEYCRFSSPIMRVTIENVAYEITDNAKFTEVFFTEKLQTEKVEWMREEQPSDEAKEVESVIHETTTMTMDK